MLNGIELQVFSAADDKLLRSATSVDGGCSIDLSDLLGQPLKFRLHDPSGEFADYYYDGDATSLDQATVVTPSLGGSYQCFAYLYTVHNGEVKGRTLSAKGQPVAGIAVSVSEHRSVTLRRPSRERRQRVLRHRRAARLARNDLYRRASIPAAATGRTWRSSTTAQRRQDDADAVSVAPGQVVTVDSHLYKSCTVQGAITDPDGPASGVATTLYDAAGNVVASTSGPLHGQHLLVHEPRAGSYRVGFYDTSQAYPDELRVYHDQFNGGAATLDAAPPIVLDGSDTSAVTVDAHDATVGRHQGRRRRPARALRPYSRGDRHTLQRLRHGRRHRPRHPGYGYGYGYLFSQLGSRHLLRGASMTRAASSRARSTATSRR